MGMKKEIKQKERNLVLKYDRKNLETMRDRWPEVVLDIEALLEVGHTPQMIGKVIRDPNPQMWVESKFAESVARAILAELSE